MNNATLTADELSDLDIIAGGSIRRPTELDNGARLVELGLARREGDYVVATDLGLDVLRASEAA